MSMQLLNHLHAIAQQHQEVLNSRVEEFSLGSCRLSFNQTSAIMGVINLSADSWYRESVVLRPEKAIDRAMILAAQGAQIIDVGAESTLPHADLIEVEKQWQRLEPVIRTGSEKGLALSVETYHPAMAQRALEAGAQCINLTGQAEASAIYRACAAHDAAVIICYVQGANVRSVKDLSFDQDPIEVMLPWFEQRIQEATSMGVQKICIDPGLGFYYQNLKDSRKRIGYQMETFLNTFRLRKLGWPVCHALPHAFEFFGEEVRTAESFFAVLALLGKTDLLRTHEVSKVRAILETLSSLPLG
jgi:dihydropteroate synthase